jgi:cell surface protein SprA
LRSGNSYKYLLVFKPLVLIFFSLLISHEASGQVNSGTQDSTEILKLNEDTGRPWDQKESSPLYLNRPSNYKSTVIYDPVKNEYIIYEKIGELNYRTPMHMSPEEYRKYEYTRAMREYWQQRISGEQGGFKSGLIPQIEVGGATFDKIFGSNVINIIPQGSAELVFGINISRTKNPTLAERLQTIPTFDFKEKIQMNVTGTIGD